MPYRWEASTGIGGRYRDTSTGRFVPAAVVRGELDAYLDNTGTAAKSIAQALRNRELSLADAEIAMRRHIKNVHLNAVALERGGWENMTPADYGRAGQIIREQYGFARNMFVQIEEGKQRLDGTLDVRMEMYTQAGRQSFYENKHARLDAAAVTHVRSIRHARDSCRECVFLDHVWHRIGDPAYKLPGQRICLTRCHCSEEYGRLDEGEPVVLEAA
jgi:hypothetical protein